MEILEREAHQQTLEQALEQVAAGSGRGVFVSGEAGVGKTTLVSRFIAGLEGRAAVLWGACDATFTRHVGRSPANNPAVPDFLGLPPGRRGGCKRPGPG